MAGLSTHLQRLLRDALRQDAARGLDGILEALVGAAGVSGAILWHLADDRQTGPQPSILAMWLGGRDAPAAPRRPDGVTLAAFETLTLALPPGPGSAGPVIAALPLGEIEGAPGVLALLGDGELTTEAFDVVVDLLDMLPDLCRVVRERQGIALVRSCNDILHDADVEADKKEVGADRVAHHLARVCAVVAEAMRCQEVAIYLQDPEAPGGDTYPLVASTPGTNPAPVIVGAGPVGMAIEKNHPVAGASAGGRQRTLMVSLVTSGEHVWGAVACAGVNGGRPPFNSTDLAALDPVTAQVGRYWHTWLQQRTIAEENNSWRLMAAGLTTFNQRLSEQLARKEPDDAQVYDAAIDVVRTVLPECAGAAVWLSPETRSGETRLERVASFGMAHEAPPAGVVRRLATQPATTEPAKTTAPGLAEDAVWLVRAPLRVSHRRHGLFTLVGTSAAPPSSSPQVCQIIADQLGLYRRLRHTLTKLQETRAALDATLRSQAEALEDLQHQLVSPLLTAAGRTDRVLLDRHLDSRVEPHLKAIRGLCRKSGRVAMSAGAFAALSKGGAPRPRLELLSADDLLRLLIFAADDAQFLGDPAQGIEFNVDRATVKDLGRRFIEADRGFVEQCVGNLLDNAAKYSFDHTRVEISGIVEPDTFSIAVTNVGLALDTADAERCLQRNWRGTAARNVTGEGSGLGLWIVDHLMRCMRGSIRIQPVGETTTVLLGFPLP